MIGILLNEANHMSVYDKFVFTCCCSATGAVPRAKLLPTPHLMVAGDILIALRSSGIHSNGYSLVRQCLSQSNLTIHSSLPYKSDYDTLGEALLVPTHIYVNTLLSVLREGWVKGLAHITGGGLTHNIPRVLPPHLVAVLHAHKHSNNTKDSTSTSATTTTSEFSTREPNKNTMSTTTSTSLPTVTQWTLPPVFAWLQQTAQLSQDDLLSTFNCGIGMVLVVGADMVSEVLHHLQECAERAFIVGELRNRLREEAASESAGAAGVAGKEEEVVYTEPQVEVVGKLI